MYDFLISDDEAFLPMLSTAYASFLADRCVGVEWKDARCSRRGCFKCKYFKCECGFVVECKVGVDEVVENECECGCPNGEVDGVTQTTGWGVEGEQPRSRCMLLVCAGCSTSGVIGAVACSR